MIPTRKKKQQLSKQVLNYWPVILIGLYFVLSGTYNLLGTNESVWWNFFYFTVERLMIVALAVKAVGWASNSVSIVAIYSLICYQILLIGIDLASMMLNASISDYLSFVNSFQAKVGVSVFMTISLIFMRYLLRKRRRINGLVQAECNKRYLECIRRNLNALFYIHVQPKSGEDRQ
jgi:hypothetical protein